MSEEREFAKAPSVEQWLKALQLERIEELDPSIWMTAKELSEKLGASRRSLQDRLKAGLESGVVERAWAFRIRRDGRHMRVEVFRLKE